MFSKILKWVQIGKRHIKARTLLAVFSLCGWYKFLQAKLVLNHILMFRNNFTSTNKFKYNIWNKNIIWFRPFKFTFKKFLGWRFSSIINSYFFDNFNDIFFFTLHFGWLYGLFLCRVFSSIFLQYIEYCWDFFN